MYYEPYQRKRRPRRRIGCIGRLIRLALVLLVVWTILMVGSNSLLRLNLGGQSLSVNANLPGTWTNLLLLGSDVDSDGTSRTDSIIVASIGPAGQLKLTSIMRDTMVDIPGHGRHKLNAAYRFGGAELAMQTINQAFGMNITRYALIDYQGFGAIVDALGGIRMDITQQEMNGINQTLTRINDQSKAAVTLHDYGKDTLLNGTQALAYARMRKLDSDYQRTGRQRAVISAILRQLRTTRNPAVLISTATTALNQVQTNLNLPQIAALGIKVLFGGASVDQFRIPIEGSYESGTQDGIWAIRPDLSANREALYAFIYQEE